MKKVIFVLFNLLFLQTTYAQYDKLSYEDALKIKQSTICVLGEKQDPNVLFEDPSVFKRVKPKSSDFNSKKEMFIAKKNIFESIFAANWTISKIDTTKNSNSNSSLGLYLKYSQSHEWERSRSYKSANTAANPTNTSRYTYDPATRTNSEVGVTLIVREIATNKDLFGVFLPNPDVSHADLTYGILLLQNIVQYMSDDKNRKYKNYFDEETAKNAVELKDVTLLIINNETELKPQQIKEVYPYPHKIVSYQEAETIMKNRESGKALMQLVVISAGGIPRRAVTVMNTQTGKLYMYDIQGTGFKMNGVQVSRVPKIDKKQLKELAKSIK